VSIGNTALSATPTAVQGESNIQIWMSAFLFSFLIFLGHGFLGSRRFFAALAVAAVVHMFAVARYQNRFSIFLFLSESMIVVVTIFSVFMYLLNAVGAASDVAAIVFWHLAGSWSQPSAYLEFAKYFVVFAGISSVFVFFAWGFRRSVGLDLVFACYYAASAVNVACDYVWRRPLFHVSGDPEALDFFFAAGLIGLEFPLLVHFIVLGLSCWQVSRVHRK
jgi:hypothetical protein